LGDTDTVSKGDNGNREKEDLEKRKREVGYDSYGESSAAAGSGLAGRI